jgi:hypothetical protein
MPIQDISEIASRYPFVTTIKEAIPFADFEIIEVDGEEKLKLNLDLTDYNSFWSLKEKYGEKLEGLPSDVRTSIDSIEFAEARCSIYNEHGLNSDLESIKQLLPEVKFLDISNTEYKKFPRRLFDKHFHDTYLGYPEGTVETYKRTQFFALEDAIRKLNEMSDVNSLENLRIGIEFDEENDREIIKIENLTEDHLSVIEIPPSLHITGFFKLVNRINFKSNFADQESFTSNLEKLGSLFQNIESLEIDKTYQEGKNRITEDFDFSPLKDLKRLESLRIPVTAPADYLFINGMKKLSDLTLLPPVGGYDSERSSEKIDLLVSNIRDNKSAEIKKLRIFHCPLSQKLFDRVCNQFDALEELDLSTVDRSEKDYKGNIILRPLVRDFSSLLQLENLEKLSIDNLVLRQDSLDDRLEHLTKLRLDDPGISTMRSFDETSRTLGSLENITVKSSYDNECKMVTDAELKEKPWNVFLAALSNLTNLSEASLMRETQSDYVSTGDGYYMSKSGGAATVEIGQSAVDELAKTKLSKIYTNGLRYNIPGASDTSYLDDARFIELVSEKRKEMEEGQKMSYDAPSTSISPAEGTHSGGVRSHKGRSDY